jgi:putative component of membrane protein insertase Oxa1/YidC/SpoIIIJ protein YidD
MKSTQIGMTGILITTTGSIAQFLETIGLSRITTTLAYKAVRGYQRYISPYKGFRCAHYQLHRETSCSGHFRDLLSQYGLSGALRLFPHRLVECRDAYFELKRLANSTPTDGGSRIPASSDSPERDEQPTEQNHFNDHDDSFDASKCACTTISCGVDVMNTLQCLGGIASCLSI